VKRRALVRHLEAHGCTLLREGANHSVYHHVANQTVSTVPRHTEINAIIARKICRDLQIPVPASR
jgi:predicted RNA binding protein YcfA (HicA-like mRNA interferase family)